MARSYTNKNTGYVNVGYDPTGTGKFGVGTAYNGTTGVNVPSTNNMPSIPPVRIFEPNWVSSSGSSASSTGSTTGNASTAVKIATSNLFVLDEAAASIESMTDLVFEEIGGQELIDITRADLAYDIQSQAESNQPIKNLGTITGDHSPKNLAGLQNVSYVYTNFAIDLANYIPQDPQGTVATSGGNIIPDKTSHVYVEKDTTVTNLDSIIIEVVNIDPNNNETVEVEILSYDQLYSGV